MDIKTLIKSTLVGDVKKFAEKDPDSLMIVFGAVGTGAGITLTIISSVTMATGVVDKLNK